MGKTFLIFRVKAEDLEKLEECVNEIKGISSGEVKDVKREPIGFGAEVIKAGILVDEKDESAIEAVTKELNALNSVEDAELEGMTLL